MKKGGGNRVIVKKIFGKRESEIIYPRKWGYTIIGTDREKMRQAVRECLLNRECEIWDSRQRGRYYSQKFEIIVESEEERDELFRRLKAHRDIKFVL